MAERRAVSRAEDTIFAVAAGGVGAALTVMRISGSAACDILTGLCGATPAPRVASLRTLRNKTGEVLDKGLALWFPGPASYTGEDCAELHLHGGRAVLTAVAEALVEVGARPAEAGEFTRRAFLSGRMDLTEAEGVADLVAAETDAQRRQALRQMQGALGALYQGWTVRLLKLVSFQEAMIEFDEDAVPIEHEDVALREIGDLVREIADHLDDNRRGERVRDGLVFAIVGAPNVGKSSLINALANRDVAIVSARPGTTRDVLEARLVLNGAAVTLLDTAGLREAGDEIEAEGIRRALARAETADLVIEVRDAQAISAPPVAAAPGRRLLVVNKIDLARAAPGSGIGVSVRTGEGMARLRDALAGEASAFLSGGTAAPLTRARHRSALQEAVERLRGGADAPYPELRAEDLRLALAALGRITGRVGVEQVLDAVFAQFCIGK